MCDFPIFDLAWVFICKQETAYEMRISDWSSDVGSSDLQVAAAVGNYDAQRLQVVERAAGDQVRRHHGRVQRIAYGVGHFVVVQIGRASCRERVCQYV